MQEQFDHVSLSLRESLPSAYTAVSKHNFHYRQHISKYVLERGYCPLNPFMIFEYFMLDTVPRNLIRQANNTLVELADELWVFGEVSDGVLAEIRIAREREKPVKYFSLKGLPKEMVELTLDEVEFEKGLEQFREEL